MIESKRVKDKVIGLIMFLIFYAISYLIAFFIGDLLENIRLKLFVFDIIATVFIYLFSLIIKNSSLYDAYRSLTPFIMVTYLFIINFNNLNVYHYLVYIAFSIWSWRLTINWIITFDNIKWVDWRYKELKEKNNCFMWQIINFFGIMLIPTLVVFIGFYPLIYVFSNSINYLSTIGVVVIFLGIILEFFADHEMHSFLKLNKKDEVMQGGLWKYSRHPNYLGEILVWAGVYLTIFPSLVNYWYLFPGLIVMIFLFNFISIPLAEKRQMKKRKNYIKYKEKVSRLLILPNKK